MGDLITLKGVRREYFSGEHSVAALAHIDLTIKAGEFVAIVGASGSGKSTLMNILGCLDRPTSGSYQIDGKDTANFAPDDLAALRREHFGFIFQRYHLMGELDAIGNVEVPAVYAGRERSVRRARAIALLERLGLGDRMSHHPSELSGGQQQRVSIARALMNGGQIILADEPTGALDSRSGEEMLRILDDLHDDGHTVIVVTHDMQVAARADRLIEIKDGLVVADRATGKPVRNLAPLTLPEMKTEPTWRAFVDRLSEAARMAVTSIIAHRLRSFLTMLGIIIGIASVVLVVALGEGSTQQVMKNISALGSNTIDIYPGESAGDSRSAAVETLTPQDADALIGQSFVDSVTPNASTQGIIRYRDVTSNGTVNGVGEQYFRVRGLNIAEGVAFDVTAVKARDQVAVIDDNTRAKLFPNGGALGSEILLGKVPVRVIGVAEKRDSGFFVDQNLNVWIPYTSVLARMTGQQYLRGITVRVPDAVSSSAAEGAINHLLTVRHGRKDFYLSNSDSIRQTIDSTIGLLRVLITSIAGIALLVGGIGVMNIMLVSVKERTREIGVRSAVGARQSDIMAQFLTEAVLLCIVGGTMGVMLALGIGAIIKAVAGSSFTPVFSAVSIFVAFTVSTAIGLGFGFFPARNAARLDPVEALSRE